MSESNFRSALRKPRVLYLVLIFGAAVPLGLGILILGLFASFAPDVRFWHLLSMLMAFPLFLSSLVGNALGLIVLAKHILQDSFGIEIFAGLGQTVRVKDA